MGADTWVCSKSYKYTLETIPILRQQKNWVGRFGKWPFLLTFSTAFMLT